MKNVFLVFSGLIFLNLPLQAAAVAPSGVLVKCEIEEGKETALSSPYLQGRTFPLPKGSKHRFRLVTRDGDFSGSVNFEDGVCEIDYDHVAHDDHFGSGIYFDRKARLPFTPRRSS